MGNIEVIDVALLSKVKSLMRRYDFLAKKRWGQNFIVDGSLIHRMTSYAAIQPEDMVLEVGAGLGFLTRALAEKGCRVIAVEVDRRLFEILREELRGFGNVTLILGDALKTPVPQFNKVVSLPPYSISSPLLFWLLKRDFEIGVLTFQKEFAERLVAPVGMKEYGRLTVTASYRADVELLEKIPKEAFYPQPKVDSSIVRLRTRKPKFRLEDEDTFFSLTRHLFSQRKKKVRNAIIPCLKTWGVGGEEEIKRVVDILPFTEKRVFSLSPEEIAEVANRIVRYRT